MNVPTKTQTPTRPTIAIRPKTKVISKPNVTQTGAQNTGIKLNERRLSRVETKTATKSRPTLSKTVVIQSDNSVKEAVNSDKTKERAKTVNKRSIVVNDPSVSSISKVQQQQKQRQPEFTETKIDQPDNTKSKIDQTVNNKAISTQLNGPLVKEVIFFDFSNS